MPRLPRDVDLFLGWKSVTLGVFVPFCDSIVLGRGA